MAPSHLLGLGSQVFLKERYCIILICQSFCEVMLDLSFVLPCTHNELLLCRELRLQDLRGREQIFAVTTL